MKLIYRSFFVTMFALLISATVFAHDIEAVNADGVTIYYAWINDSTELAVSYRTVSHGGGSYSIYHEYYGSVVIPESVTYNGITYGVTSIGSDAFQSCSGLISVTIPKSIKTIGHSVFYGCGNLASIIVDAENPKYDSRDNCNAIIETNTSTLIVGCKNTTIPLNVTGIGQNAFEGCSDLASVTIHAGITSIGRGAFSECANLTNITVDPENTKYDSRDNCNAIIETNTNTLISGCKTTSFPNNLSSIGEYAFYHCLGLRSVEIPDNVRNIGSSAFEGCNDLSFANIGDGVTIIETNTFRNCKELKTITFGSNVQEIKSGALVDCNNLGNIISLNDVPPSLARSIFTSRFWAHNSILVQVPIGSLEAYRNADVWKYFTYIIEGDFSNLGAYYIIDELNFPDERFREYLINEPFGIDRVLTEEEIAGITTLDVSNLSISDLKGIEYFTALKKLLCYKNNLTELNLSANKQLKEVDCYSNQIMGIKMDSLIASLPTLNEGEGSLYVLDATDEGNICFTEQVLYAKSKGWNVYYYTGSDWQEYEGHEPGILITEEYFPDENFRDYLKSQDYGKDMFISDEEIRNITSINVGTISISTLKGIEYFTSLQSLKCYVTELDVSKNTELRELSCGGMSRLDVSKNTNLISLECSGNQLTELDVSNNTALTSLSCVFTGLHSLDVSKNVALTELSCLQNFSLTSIDVSKNKALTWLSCPQNMLSELDISKNTALTYLFCPYNQLKSLDVSKNGELTELACMGNKLTKLDVSKNLKLTTLKCQENGINEERMYQLIESLPTQTSATLCVINLQGADENICTKVQVKRAKEKGWKVMWGYEYYNSGPDGFHPYYYEYEGSDSEDIYIDEETFPDPYFCEYLKKQPYGENSIITKEEIETITSINVDGDGRISSLKGIELFTALEKLSCYENQLTSLDVSQNTALTLLNCWGNQLTSLDVSKNTALTLLDCINNQLTSLDVSHNTALNQLFCSDNQLTSLDVSNNTELWWVYCYRNQLSSLGVSKKNTMGYLELYSNNIKENEMQTLVSNLPQQTDAKLVVVDLSDESEGNVCTTIQVAIAKEKGWRVMATRGFGFFDYKGSDPSGIQGITLEKNPNAPVYDLNGRRLTEPAKGINIIGGKKVLNY